MAVTGQPTFDTLTEQKFDAVKNYAFFQNNKFMEAATGGCAPNKYVFGDMDRPQQVPGRKEDETIPHALYVVEEESSCCCRLCCNGNQPFVGKMYHAQAPVAGKECCGFYSGHIISADKSQPAVMTMARPGCCSKCANGCCVCASMCQNEMFNFVGDKGSDQDANALAGDGSHVGHSIVPCGGGGCTPTIDLFATGQQFGVLEGPTCFGGCYDLFCTTPFFFSSQPGKTGDLAFLEKQKPEDCFNLCCAVCSDADQYKIEMRQDKMPSSQKAQILATAVQLDLLFFENDQHFCQVEETSDGKGVVITITLCMWYMWGCLMPVQCCIVLTSNSDGG